jgi:hypothetical protein
MASFGFSSWTWSICNEYLVTVNTRSVFGRKIIRGDLRLYIKETQEIVSGCMFLPSWQCPLVNGCQKTIRSWETHNGR